MTNPFMSYPALVVYLICYIVLIYLFTKNIQGHETNPEDL